MVYLIIKNYNLINQHNTKRWQILKEKEIGLN